jgi:hypothetical protein
MVNEKRIWKILGVYVNSFLNSMCMKVMGADIFSSTI